MRKQSAAMTSVLKASVLMVLLVLVLFAYYFINKDFLKQGSGSDPSQGIFNGVVTDYHKIKRFTDEQKDTLRRQFAGFWRFGTDSTVSANVRKSDCLEFKDNGIIWEVINWDVVLPSDDTLRLYHVLTGYVSPYSSAPYDSHKVIAEVRILRQALISGNDTCYGKSNIDELWEFAKDEKGFKVNHRSYIPYKGELNRFFPVNILSAVDKLTIQECADQGMGMFAKRKFTGAFANEQFVGVNVIKSYYEPLFVEELTRRFPVEKIIPESLSVNYTKDKNGLFAGCHLTNKVVKRKFEEQFLIELGTWKLPSGSDDNGKYTFHFHF